MAVIQSTTRPLGYKAPARQDINTTDAQYAQGVRQLDKPGIGALQQITNPMSQLQALRQSEALIRSGQQTQRGAPIIDTGSPGPGMPVPQRQVVTSTLAARALQAGQPPAQPVARLDQLRGAFAPTMPVPTPAQQIMAQAQAVNPNQLSLPGPGFFKPAPVPQPKPNQLSLPGPNPYGANPLGTYTPPGLNQTMQMQGAPKYQPPGLVPQFQMSQMAYKPPQPAPSLGKPFTGTYQGPNTNQAQQLAAQALRNK